MVTILQGTSASLGKVRMLERTLVTQSKQSISVIISSASLVFSSLPANVKRILIRENSLSGTFPSPDGVSSLLDLLLLNLSNNGLTGRIPPTIGNTPRLKELNLSNNELSGVIEKELGLLSGNGIRDEYLAYLTTSNLLVGSIPEKMKKFTEGRILLGGNEKLTRPSWVLLASLGFYLKNDPVFCPSEQNALQEFFDTKWINSYGWGDQFLDVCDCYGITCSNDTNKPVRLELGNNALSGMLSEGFGELVSLEEIDLSDKFLLKMRTLNCPMVAYFFSSIDIKCSIPSGISNMENLRVLRLSYNQLTSSIPPEDLIWLNGLELVHFQSNRLTGTLSLSSELMVDLRPLYQIAVCLLTLKID
ncbi:LOW QUALITY PROTEIN: hypothetical protein ACHAWO_010026 [Cyclotella atomus]|uniref:Uncharacterized protein n=1 Tax=Cyclotella atomus TaxID=382360 RepID=A0ABD3NWK6_9STRA